MLAQADGVHFGHAVLRRVFAKKSTKRINLAFDLPAGDFLLHFPQLLGLLLLVNVLSVCPTMAVSTDTWVGGSGNNFSTAANWTYSSGSGPIASGDSLVFAATGSTTPTNDLSSFSFGGITFNSGASAFTFTGNAFTLTGGITNNGSNLEAITNNISLGAATMVTNTASGSLAFGGIISGANSLTLAGTGTDTLAGANTYSGATTLGGSTNDQITVILGNKNAFGGGAVSTETLNGPGSVTLQAATDLSGANAITNKFTLNTASGVTSSSFNILGANNLTLAGPFSAGYNMYFSNGLTGGATLTLSSNVTVSGRNINFNGSGNTTISGNIVAVNGLYFNGTGITTIGGTNGNSTGSGYSLFRMNSTGPVVLGTTQSVGNNTTLLEFWGSTPVLQASADLSAGINIASVLFNAKATFSGANNMTFNCGITNGHASGSTLTNNISSGKTLAFTGPFYLSDAGYSGNIAFDIAGTGNTTFGGPIVNGSAATASLIISNTGVTTMSGANTYNGSTTISAGTLALTGSGSLAYSPLICLAGGTTLDASGLSSALELQPGQVISNSSSSTVALAGNIDASQGTIALTLNPSVPAFTISNGIFTVSTNSIIVVNNIAPTPGPYSLIKNAGGRVAGVVPTNTFSFGHAVGYFTINNGELDLVVANDPPASANYYVSTTGSDISGDGSLGNPWQTITKARSVLENLSVNTNIFVNLRGGRYFITNTISFTTADSGVNGYYITYQSYPGETAIIDGGQQVTGWTQVPGQPYWVASVPTNAGFANYFRQLYVNGLRAVRAHSDWINGAAYIWTNGASFNYSTASTGLTNVYGIAFATSSGLKNYSNVNDLRLFDVWHYKEFEIPVISITTNSGKINLQLQQPYCQYSYNTSYGGGTFFQATGAWMIVNAFEELNEPGEWYLNRATQQVFYYPSSFENMSNAVVFAPVVEDLLNLNGDSAASKLQNLRFQNLTFEHGNWFFPGSYFIGATEGESLLQAAQPSDGVGVLGYNYNVPGAIRLTNTVGIQFIGNTIRHQGTCGINACVGARNTLIQGNLFQDLTGAAVINYVSGYIGHRGEVCSNTVVADNVVRDTGADFMQSTLVNIAGGYGTQVVNNDLADCQYDGIIQTMGSSTLAGNDGEGGGIIASNRIKLAMVGQRYEVQDGGYIYNSGVCPPYCLITGNDLDGLNVLPTMEDGWVNGIYQDFGSYGLIWSNNVIRNCSPNSLAGNWVRVDTVDPNTCAQYNTYTDCTNRQSGATELAIWSGYYVITTNGAWPGGATPITSGVWPAGAQAIMQGAGVGPAYSSLLNGVYSGTNLCRGQFTWSSSSNALSSSAVDWNYLTSWHSAPNDTNSWWAVDLGAPYVIQRLELVPNTATNESAARCNFQVQGANDTNFTSYAVLAEQNSTPFAYKQINLLNSWIKYVNNPGGYRYLRVQKTSGTALGFSEVQAYGYLSTVPTISTNLSVSVSTNTLTLSWPANYLGWVLQVQTNSLTTGLTTNWVVIPGSSVVTMTNIPLDGTSPAVFYRLMYQP